MTRRDDTRGGPRALAPPQRRQAERLRSLERPVDELGAERRRAPAAIPAARSGPSSTVREMLAMPGTLRRIMLLREILGPPKGLE
jgi:hypothetical protein